MPTGCRPARPLPALRASTSGSAGATPSRGARSCWCTQVDPDRDGRLFEPVVAAVERIAPGVEILRSGVVACSARGPSRYFGSETAAAERIVDVVEALDVECRVGVADHLAVAVLAARRAMHRAAGRSRPTFCAPLPITELAQRAGDRAARARGADRPADPARHRHLPARSPRCPTSKVATRFGADAVQAHRLAQGLAERGLSRRQIPEDLAVEQVCDPPLDRVDTAAFAAPGAGRAVPRPARRRRSRLHPAGHHRGDRARRDARPGSGGAPAR